MQPVTITENVQKVFDLGQANNMTFLTAKPEEWNTEPLFWWDFTIPYEGMRRANLVLKSEIPVERFLKGHEVETKPKPALKPWVVPTIPEIPWKELAKVAAVVLGVLAVVVAAMFALFVAIMALAICGTDPAVIAVVDGVPILLYSYTEVE